MFETNTKNIYIIYAHSDSSAVKGLINDISTADIEIWEDTSGLKPGTHDWEQELRQAIQSADVVLLIATPMLRRLLHIRDEVALAKMEAVPIFPIWLEGASWHNCIPAGYDFSRYIDIRADNYEAGLQQIRQVLAGESVQLQTQEFEAITQADDADSLPEMGSDAIRNNPYKGLYPFTANDNDVFFGREGLIQEVIDDVRDSVATLPFLCLVGASGSGKTSLIQAGVLPELQAGSITQSNNWYYTDIFTPTNQPITNLAHSLQKFFPETPLKELVDTLNHPATTGLHRLAQQVVEDPQHRLVLVIDALEELYTLTQDNDERQQFMDVLTTAIEVPNSVMMVIASLSADYYDRPLQHVQFGRLLDERHRTILPLTLTQLYHAIQFPADLPDVQVKFEKGLIAEIAFAMRGNRDALPLVQLTLTQLFFRRNGSNLTWTAYEVIGGVERVIDAIGERTLNNLPSDDHVRATRILFLGLVQLAEIESDTLPHAVKRSDLVSASGVLEETVDIFLNAGLLRSEIIGDENIIRIIHPIVLRRWERLRHWLNQAREDRLFEEQLQADIQAWRDSGQAQEKIYQGSQLEKALIWAERNTPSPAGMHFIQLAIQYRDAIETFKQEQIDSVTHENAAKAKQARISRNTATVLFLLAALFGIVGGALFYSAQQRLALVSAVQTRDAELSIAQGTLDNDLLMATQIGTEIAGTQSRLVDVQTAIVQAKDEAAGEIATQFLQTQTQIVGLNLEVEAQATQVASNLNAQRLIQERIATLGAGSIVIPLEDLTLEPEVFIATQTQIADLNNWNLVQTIDSFGVQMVLVPAGCFYMGSTSQADERPPHQVCFDSAFWIDKFEMTNELYREVTNRRPPSQFNNDKSPVDSISWFAARDACERRNGRLPSEAEWEYAARGVDSLLYPWGNQFMPDIVIYGRAAELGTVRVMSASNEPIRLENASWVGAVDLVGNVAEWTNTIYDEVDFSRQVINFQNLYPYPYVADDGREADESFDEFNERIATQSLFTLRVIRGGSFTSSVDNLRLSKRSFEDGDDQLVTVGFRCVRSVE